MGALRDLREYIEWLKGRNKLVEIDDELSPILEIPAVLRQIMYNRGPSVVFTNVKGFPGWRVAGNLFPDITTFRESLGLKRFEEVGEFLLKFAPGQMPSGLMGKIKGLTDLTKVAGFAPKRVKKAEFKENVINADDDPLDKLPAFKTWPKDGGRYLTFPLVITRDPETGVNNMGVYRVMLLDGKRGVIHWQIHKRGSLAHQKAIEKSKDEMPVAIAIGVDPGTMFTGVAPVPYPLDKYVFAGSIRGEGVEVFELDNGILVPAHAEVILEGYVKTKELVDEGPFGDHFGYYDKPQEKYPVFYVEKMYHRDNPIYYGSVVGKPPLEDAVIGKAIERVFLPILKFMLPEVVDMNLPEYGVFQGVLIVSIKKRYPGHAKKVMMALWGLGQTALNKIIIVVDHTINVHNLNEVIWAVSANVNPQRDVLVVPYTHTDALDPAMISPSYGSKLGIDATKKLPEENDGKEWPEELVEDEELLDKLRSVINKILGENFDGEGN